MTDRTELARDLAVLADERRASLGRHPSDDELALFAAGDLPAAERDRIEEHIALCDASCGRRLLAAFDDLDAFEADEPVPGEPLHLCDPDELEARGRALEDEMLRQSSPPTPWKRHLALAMAVLAGMVGGYLVSLVVNGPEPPVTVNEPPPPAEKPVVGGVVKTLFPQGSRVRSTGSDVARIETGPGDFVFLLRPPSDAEGFPGRLLEIEGPTGRLAALGVHGSQVQGDDGLVVRIPRAILPPGAYQLTLVGDSDPVAIYEVEVYDPSSS